MTRGELSAENLRFVQDRGGRRPDLTSQGGRHFPSAVRSRPGRPVGKRSVVSRRAKWRDIASRQRRAGRRLRSSASFTGDEGAFKNKITASSTSKVHALKRRRAVKLY